MYPSDLPLLVLLRGWFDRLRVGSRVIDELAELIVRANEVARQAGSHQLRVLVDGHADTGERPEPTPAPLQDLCKARANAVKDRLVEQGVPADIIITLG